MHTQDHGITVGQSAVHPFNLIGIHVGRAGLYRRRQVDDDRAIGGGLPGFDHGIAHVQGKVQLGGAEGFWAVLKRPGRVGLLCGQFGYQGGMAYSQIFDLVLRHAKDHIAPRWGRGVVQVDDGFGCAAQGFKRAADQIFSGLGDDFDRDVRRNMPFINQLPDKIKVSLRCSREGHFDFFETHRHQGLEQLQLRGLVHGLEQGLVAVPQVGAHPDGWRLNGFTWPGAVGDGNGWGCAVLLCGGGDHGHGASLSSNGLKGPNPLAGAA